MFIFFHGFPKRNYSLFSVFTYKSLKPYILLASQIIYQFIGIPKLSLALLICY